MTTSDQDYYIGKRIIVMWTQRAYNRGSDWPSFRVLDVSDEGFFCEGVDSPDGSKHDGSKAFIPHNDYVDFVIWKEDT